MGWRAECMCHRRRQNDEDLCCVAPSCPALKTARVHEHTSSQEVICSVQEDATKLITLPFALLPPTPPSDTAKEGKPWLFGPGQNKRMSVCPQRVHGRNNDRGSETLFYSYLSSIYTYCMSMCKLTSPVTSIYCNIH